MGELLDTALGQQYMNHKDAGDYNLVYSICFLAGVWCTPLAIITYRTTGSINMLLFAVATTAYFMLCYEALRNSHEWLDVWENIEEIK